MTHGTKTGMAQFNKGISELTNGLGELGPAVTMVQTAFNKVRAVFDLFIGTFRFLTELPGMFTKFMGKKELIRKKLLDAFEKKHVKVSARN